MATIKFVPTSIKRKKREKAKEKEKGKEAFTCLWTLTSAIECKGTVGISSCSFLFLSLLSYGTVVIAGIAILAFD
jgi:hypothetical protein